ncbi:bifunctional DNA-formamidopyrimidine glycosylase/DNA-(apurinic or apyrimidinic site) lyase [Allokutzneria sp. NRRL B-24872]|uniref:bifunctional DNA-formamidopyrimidine glycosylase/DNA-(apurinic or apyrimidinic site) lyase n=1 Tax=Allokutzneria sp. NRRL B-24872 TaxID=1137961 RepID=UPI000A3BA34B|nr:bifunctional DNA-formamidopyrimidine glycosylase/DNA-(apurinic or apyrimidinic site) lyase [Allokutzneria sp. NRRL B-24872]
MPELPEVEVVRAGLQRHVAGRTVAEVEVLHPRAVRRHVPGPVDFATRLSGRRFDAACRRGKYLWIELDGAAEAIVSHLGMSGQMLVQPVGTPDEKHLRVRVRFADDGPELRFVDQRTFGGLALTDVVAGLPVPIAHIGRDPLDPEFDLALGVAALRARRTEVKRALLDQTVVSGIGNIYADEALWRTKLHWSRAANGLSRPKAVELLEAATEVMREALVAGGTSFDALYVNVNGQSGYFDRSLAAYGQQDRPCGRCGTAIIREAFMNRSSFSCPKCQRAPR